MALATMQQDTSLYPPQVLFLQMFLMAMRSISKSALVTKLEDVCISKRPELIAIRSAMGELIDEFDEQGKKIHNENSEYRNDSIIEDKFLKQINKLRENTPPSNNPMKRMFQSGYRKFERLLLGSSSIFCVCKERRKEYHQYKDAIKQLVKDTSSARDIMVIATKGGNTDFVKVLLGAGVKVDVKDGDGLTPLHWAARMGHPDIVQFLVNSGANIDAKTTNGDTPLHWAAYNGSVDTCRVLLAAGAKVNVKDSDGWTALHIAANWADPVVCQLLLDSGADIDALNNNMETALHRAALQRKADVVHLLLASGADRNLRDKYGRIPLDIARFWWSTQMIKELETV